VLHQQLAAQTQRLNLAHCQLDYLQGANKRLQNRTQVVEESITILMNRMNRDSKARTTLMNKMNRVSKERTRSLSPQRHHWTKMKVILPPKAMMTIARHTRTLLTQGRTPLTMKAALQRVSLVMRKVVETMLTVMVKTLTLLAALVMTAVLLSLLLK